jgi:DnaJ-class molecular chaperone
VARNYYIILGVDPDATQDQIKSAYRRKAKQSHPDICEGGGERFRDVQDAYETLSDPARRRVYDDELTREMRRQAPPQGMRAEPLRSRRCPIEPLIPTGRPVGMKDAPFDRFSYPSTSETLSSLRDDLDSPLWHRSRESEGIPLDIPLTREQALRGGRVRVWVPVQARCPNCHGFGSVGFYACGECFGEGTVVERTPVWVAFPGGISDGSMARVSLARLGGPQAYLTLCFRVRGA